MEWTVAVWMKDLLGLVLAMSQAVIWPLLIWMLIGP
jgi:hypothetical protein